MDIVEIALLAITTLSGETRSVFEALSLPCSPDYSNEIVYGKRRGISQRINDEGRSLGDEKPDLPAYYIRKSHACNKPRSGTFAIAPDIEINVQFLCSRLVKTLK
jgi:hypothetical protein